MRLRRELGGVKSPAETLLAVQLEQAGIPFEREYKFHPSRKWRADFWVLKPRSLMSLSDLLIEIDGGSWLPKGRHTTGKGFAADCEKQNAAAELGYPSPALHPGHDRIGRGVGADPPHPVNEGGSSMTDRAVQPEAPTHFNRAGVEFVTASCDVCEFTHAHTVEQARAASQERPQPDDVIALGRLLGRVQQMYEDWPTLDMEIEADIAQAKAAIESRGVAQERPSIDVAAEVAYDMTIFLHGAEMAPNVAPGWLVKIREWQAALAGGSVASPEPRP
jgi:hypothetical protein